MRPHLLVLALFVAAPVVVAPAVAGAQSAQALDLERVGRDLQSGEPERMLRALEAIAAAAERGDARAKQAAPLVEALLRRGASAEICARALGVAGLLGLESLSAAMAPYVRHRIPEVRHAAARALARTGGPDAALALRRALRSQDATLRVLAARGLGELGATDALADLEALLERGMAEAAAPIARLCSRERCQALLAKASELPFAVLAESCDTLLFRPSAEVPDAVKIQAIDRLQASQAQEAAKVLQDLQRRWPKAGSAAVKKALDRAVEATRGADES
jgi:HEAT repeat protein